MPMNVQCINGYEKDERIPSQVPQERSSRKEIEFTERDVEICTGFTEAAVLDAMAYISPDGFDDDDVDLVELAGVVRDYMIELISPKESDEIKLIETERHPAIELTEKDKEMCAAYVVYPWRDGVKYIGSSVILVGS